MGWKHRLSNLELVRHGTPRLDNLTGTRAWTELTMKTGRWSKLPQGREAAQLLCGKASIQLTATVALFLTYVNCFAESGAPAAGCP
jgi:hypothetical protein